MQTPSQTAIGYTMEPKQLTAAIKKLKTAHKLGHKILKKLDTAVSYTHLTLPTIYSV